MENEGIDVIKEESNPITQQVSSSSQISPTTTSSSSSPSPLSAPFTPSLTTAQLDLLYGQTLSVILPNELYLSDYQAPLDEKLLKLLGVTHIINASNGSVPNQFPDQFKYFNVNVEDDDDADMTPYFELIYDFLTQQQTTSSSPPPPPPSPQQPKIILFHCKLGISRSPALVIGYLMKNYHFTLREAYDKTKSKRSKIQPGLSFCKSLMEYERMVYPDIEENSITIQALCGGNQRYSVVSRHSASSIQRQSSIGEKSRSVSGGGSLSKSHQIKEEGESLDNEKRSSLMETKKSSSCGCCIVM